MWGEISRCTDISPLLHSSSYLTNSLCVICYLLFVVGICVATSYLLRYKTIYMMQCRAKNVDVDEVIQRVYSSQGGGLLPEPTESSY